MVMGLSRGAFWLAHFLVNLSKVLVPTLLLTAVLFVLFPNYSPPAVTLFLLLYGLNALLFAFAVSSIIGRGTHTFQRPFCNPMFRQMTV